MGAKWSTLFKRRVVLGRLVALYAAGREEPQSKQQALMMQPGCELGAQNNCSPVWPYGKNKWIDSLDLDAF